MPDFSFISRIFKDYLLPTSCPACFKNTDKCGICESCCKALENAVLSNPKSELVVDGYTVKCRSVFSYEDDIVRNLVLFMKENPEKTVFRYLAAFIAREVKAFGVDEDAIVTYVPRSNEGLRNNGFDQSEMLAKEVSHVVPKLKFARLLKRCGISKAQKRLSGKDRKENVKGKFRAAKKAASPKSIVIIDDMFTTGSSISECAAVLKKAYPSAEISCVTVAKNP